MTRFVWSGRFHCGGQGPGMTMNNREGLALATGISSKYLGRMGEMPGKRSHAWRRRSSDKKPPSDTAKAVSASMSPPLHASSMARAFGDFSRSSLLPCERTVEAAGVCMDSLAGEFVPPVNFFSFQSLSGSPWLLIVGAYGSGRGNQVVLILRRRRGLHLCR